MNSHLSIYLLGIIFLFVSCNIEQSSNNNVSDTVKLENKEEADMTNADDHLYQKVGNNKYERVFTKESAKVLAELLDVEIESGVTYDGSIGYIKDVKGNFIKDGQFSLKGGHDYIAGTESRNLKRYSGKFANNLKHGLFEKKDGGYESDATTQIYFERNICVWTSYAQSAEGEKFNHRDENPANCIFSIVDSLGWEAMNDSY